MYIKEIYAKQDIANYSDHLQHFADFGRYDHSVSVPAFGSLFRQKAGTAIAELQRALAIVYGAKFAYPSTNGTTALNVAATLAVTQPGDTILVQRDCHVSFFSPMITGDLTPVYIEPAYDQALGIHVGISPEHLHFLLETMPQIKSVFLTWPNYFGIAYDLARCAKLVTGRGLPVVVDNAHGSHFGFHPHLPHSAQSTGASIVTQSTHKTCGALSQGSVALFNDTTLIEPFYRVVNAFGLLSTSFSFPILASLGIAALHLQMSGQQDLGVAIEVAQRVRAGVNAIDPLSCFDSQNAADGLVSFDPLRVTVNVAATGLTGFEVEHWLIDGFQIYPELATLQNVLFLFTMAHTAADGARLLEALQTLVREHPRVAPKPPLPLPPMPPQRLTPRQAYFHRAKRQVPIHQSVGCISAETIACYPPGSALIVAGEEITWDVLTFLEETHRQGGSLKGASDDQAFKTITIIDAN